MKTSMKIFAIASIIAASAASANGAGGYAEAGSQASTGSLSATGNIGNGFAIQGSRGGAWNESSASVSARRGEVETSASTEGGSYSSSWGVAHHAVGLTGGYAGQTGYAGAEGLSFAPQYHGHHHDD